MRASTQRSVNPTQQIYSLSSTQVHTRCVSRLFTRRDVCSDAAETQRRLTGGGTPRAPRPQRERGATRLTAPILRPPATRRWLHASGGGQVSSGAPYRAASVTSPRTCRANRRTRDAEITQQHVSTARAMHEFCERT